MWVGVSKVNMGRCPKGDLKCSETSLPKVTGSKVMERLQKNIVAVPKRYNPAGYDASPSVTKMENNPKKSRADPTFIAKRVSHLYN